MGQHCERRYFNNGIRNKDQRTALFEKVGSLTTVSKNSDNLPTRYVDISCTSDMRNKRTIFLRDTLSVLIELTIDAVRFTFAEQSLN